MGFHYKLPALREELKKFDLSFSWFNNGLLIPILERNIEFYQDKNPNGNFVLVHSFAINVSNYDFSR